jgi:integrase
LIIPETLAIELEELKAKRDRNVSLVFHRNGVPISRKAVQDAYNKTLRELGITHLSGTHIIRKASATHVNEITGDLHSVQTQLDHSSPNITLRYVAQTRAKKQKVAAALDSVLAGFTREKTEQRGAPVPHCPPPEQRPKLVLIRSVG